MIECVSVCCFFEKRVLGIFNFDGLSLVTVAAVVVVVVMVVLLVVAVVGIVVIMMLLVLPLSLLPIRTFSGLALLHFCLFSGPILSLSESSLLCMAVCPINEFMELCDRDDDTEEGDVERDDSDDVSVDVLLAEVDLDIELNDDDRECDPGSEDVERACNGGEDVIKVSGLIVGSLVLVCELTFVMDIGGDVT